MEYESDTTMKGLKVNWITESILKEKLKDSENMKIDKVMSRMI